jgi:hypothetical protein
VRAKLATPLFTLATIKYVEQILKKN